MTHPYSTADMPAHDYRLAKGLGVPAVTAAAVAAEHGAVKARGDSLRNRDARPGRMIEGSPAFCHVAAGGRGWRVSQAMAASGSGAGAVSTIG